MDLGAFSVSLAVADLARSRAFYEALGFQVSAGSLAQNYLILRNGETTLGLFQGMFEKNLLTCNTGLRGSDMSQPESFDDVRQIADALEARGVDVERHVENPEGPAYITLIDPDGNPILIDQHR